MAGQEKAAGSADDSGIARLEYQAAVLARLLEALNRRRTYPLERSHYLLLLRLSDGPQKIGSLSAALALDGTTVTRQVAAMEARGLVSRRPDPEDRRSALVEQTPEGSALVTEMRDMRRERIGRLVSDWSETEVARFAADLDRFNAALFGRLKQAPDESPAPEDGPGA